MFRICPFILCSRVTFLLFCGWCDAFSCLGKSGGDLHARWDSGSCGREAEAASFSQKTSNGHAHQSDSNTNAKRSKEKSIPPHFCASGRKMEALRGTISYLCRFNRVIKEAGIDVESDLWRLMSRRAVIPELLCVCACV